MSIARKRELLKGMALSIAIVGFHAGVVFATPTLGTDTFDGGAANGWTSLMETIPLPAGTADTAGVVFNNNNWYYQMFFSPTGPAQQDGYIYNGSPSHQGDYSSTFLTFDFFSSPAPPTVGLSVYFIGNGEQWNHSFVVPSNQWTTVTMGFGSGWTGGTDFLAAVTNITFIGIYVNNLTVNGSSFTYGLDNWTVSVPEPETMALVMVVVFSLLITFRQPLLARCRRKESGTA